MVGVCPWRTKSTKVGFGFSDFAAMTVAQRSLNVMQTPDRHAAIDGLFCDSAASRDNSATAALGELENELVGCRRCPRLVEWREHVGRTKRAAYRDEQYWALPVPGFGDPQASLLVCGLAPGAHGANRTGRMFTGDRSGDWLYRALWRAGYGSKESSTSREDGLTLHGAWITSAVKCAPPDNKPRPQERDNCGAFLVAELAALSALKVIVVLGGFAHEVICRHFDLRPRPKFRHGQEVALGDGVTLLCCFHVSQQNTFTGRLTEAMLDAIFARARELAV